MSSNEKQPSLKSKGRIRADNLGHLCAYCRAQIHSGETVDEVEGGGLYHPVCLWRAAEVGYEGKRSNGR